MIEDDDQLMRELSCLPTVEPAVEWEARVRARCHEMLNKRAGSRHGPRERKPGPRLRELAAMAALCVYFAAMVTEALRLSFR